ncbi:hypothetical protein [Butyrivibrio sp. AE3004]|uniref:hypothetical protein n=1 Tax=Butyrivibrio sp. AE3004 TaxID=1506994 RepID=UPI000494C033|nr:hypothetical protein [Butyrivibrio sp. AE3004]
MNNEQHDAIMKEYRKQLTASYTRGVVTGLKLGANYVAECLKSPEEWVKLEKDELMDILGNALAMAETIKNGRIGVADMETGEVHTEDEDDDDEDIDDEDIDEDEDE